MKNVPHRRALTAKMVNDGFGKMDEDLDVFSKEGEAVAVFQYLDQRAKTHGPEDIPGARFTFLAGAHDFIRRVAFREWKSRLNDERSPQKNDEQHTERSPDEQNEGGFPIVERRPEFLPAHLHHDESRDGEDGSGDKRFAHRGGGASNVLLQHGTAEKR